MKDPKKSTLAQINTIILNEVSCILMNHSCIYYIAPCIYIEMIAPTHLLVCVCQAAESLFLS